ncbi:YkvA family protein [Micromonospora carbonacea]|uniref:YkvA family protein n=1 Tax=Micromonospora carbonacea TaxID=47853 RepID=UPI00371639B7
MHLVPDHGLVWRDWAVALAGVVALLLASWALLILLARRLPPGLLRDLAAFVPDCVTMVRRLRRDPRVPRRAKVAVLLAGLWVASPVDLIPEFLPVIGPLDDIVVVALALRYAGRQVPRDVLLAAWPGEARLIERLLGTPAASRASSPRIRQGAGD